MEWNTSASSLISGIVSASQKLRLPPTCLISRTRDNVPEPGGRARTKEAEGALGGRAVDDKALTLLFLKGRLALWVQCNLFLSLNMKPSVNSIIQQNSWSWFVCARGHVLVWGGKCAMRYGINLLGWGCLQVGVVVVHGDLFPLNLQYGHLHCFRWNTWNLSG